MKRYERKFKEGSELLKIKIIDKRTKKLKGYMDTDKFMVSLNVPKSSNRFLQDIVATFNRKSDEAIAEIILATEK